METVHGEVRQVARDVQTLLVSQAATVIKVDALTVALAEIRPDLKQIPNFERRITMLERIVLGACATILLAVLAMFLRGGHLGQ